MIDEKKLIEELNKVTFEAEVHNSGYKGTRTEKMLRYEDVVSIINKQPKVGEWIPCSERLPKEPKTNPVLEGKNLELYLVTTEYGSNEQDKVYPFRAFWNGVNFTDGWHILDVIAWQPLPEPYKED